MTDARLRELIEKDFTNFETEYCLPAITKCENDEHLHFARKGRFTFLKLVFEELIEIYRNSTHANYWCQIDRQFIKGDFAVDLDDKTPLPIPQNANSIGALAISWENYQRFTWANQTEDGSAFDFGDHILDILGIQSDDTGWNRDYEFCRDHWTNAMDEIEGIGHAGTRIRARLDFLIQTKEYAQQDNNRILAGVG